MGVGRVEEAREVAANLTAELWPLGLWRGGLQQPQASAPALALGNPGSSMSLSHHIDGR